MRREFRRLRLALEHIAAGDREPQETARRALAGEYPLTLEHTQNMRASLAVAREEAAAKARVEIYKIQLLCARAYGTTVHEIISYRQGKTACRARHVAMWLSRRTLGLSYTMLGKTFERDRTTILIACRKVTRRRADYLDGVRDERLRSAIATAAKSSAADLHVTAAPLSIFTPLTSLGVNANATLTPSI